MQCNTCNKKFELSLPEEKAYQSFNLPAPQSCQECRQIRRLAFRNEKTLYYNKSAISGRQIIALYPKDSPFKIIDQDEWWSDDFDAEKFGREFDFNRPFFEQFQELQLSVPRWGRIFLNCDNSDFTNNCANTKNSYLCFSSDNIENLFYCLSAFNCNNCVDCMFIYDCQYCSQSINTRNSYNVHYSNFAENCRDSYYLFDCKSCQDCILCANIRGKKYMILNKQYSKEDYFKYKQQFIEKLHSDKQELEKMYRDLCHKIPHRNLKITNCEASTGDVLMNCKNVKSSFYVTNCEDCTNAYSSVQVKSSCDILALDKSELCLEVDTAHQIYQSVFSTYVISSNNLMYCDQCASCENCLGCVGIKRGKYMILNKKYSPEEYRELTEKIKNHMMKTGEYGQPFPIELSPFAYNETVAQDFSPITKETAKDKGLKWYEEKQEAKYYAQKHEFPRTLSELDESICSKILTCEETGKNYKIIHDEFKFYKQFSLPIPRICPDQRYKKFLSSQNPHKTRGTNCYKCQKQIETSYPESSGLKIFCEDCFLSSIY